MLDENYQLHFYALYLLGELQDRDIDEFVRSAMLDVMGQLYLDGILEENEWKDFLKQCVYDGREYDYVYNSIRCVLCKSFCAEEALRHWAMFSESEENVPEEKDLEKLIRILEREGDKSVCKMKIGRNDPCPCGSGKKYKFCCLNKPKNVIDLIEEPEERNKWLKSYPYTGKEKVEGRSYLEDYYDEVSIETDKVLYLALMNRPGLIWNRNIEEEEKRLKEYLYLAFQKCRVRMEKEQISSFTEYNGKYKEVKKFITDKQITVS